MNELTIKPASFKKDHEEIFDIRNVVYIKGQDCPYDEEFDGFDDDSEHFLSYIGEKVVGYCRLRMVDKKAKLERFSVYEEWRGKGIGRALVKHLLKLLENRRIKDKYLNAQTRVKEFYERLGFKERGELFMEAGIEHVAMYHEEQEPRRCAAEAYAIPSFSKPARNSQHGPSAPGQLNKLGNKYYFFSKMADKVLVALKTQSSRVHISTDLNLSEKTYEISLNRLMLDEDNALGVDDLNRITKKARRIFCLENGSLDVVEERGTEYYKLVPTDSAPFLEISGVKMHISKGICPFTSAKGMAEAVVNNGHQVLDTCGGLGYAAIGALTMGAHHVDCVELSKEVIRLRRQNPWSQRLECEQASIVNDDISAHIKKLKTKWYDSIVHDPPRFSLAGELYSQAFYDQLHRVLRTRGKLFHYTGNPFSVRRGDSFVTGIVKRLKQSGFATVKKEPSLMGIVATRG